MKKILYLLPLFLVLFAIACASDSENAEIDAKSGASKSVSKGMLKSESDYIKMKLEFDEKRENVIITMSAKTEGWLSVGFEPSRMMKDAEIFIAYVSDGEVTFSHHYGSSSVKHKKIEGSEDYTEILSHSVKDGWVKVKFSRSLDAEGEYYKTFEKGREMRVIYAIGKENNFKSRHIKRGSGTVVVP